MAINDLVASVGNGVRAAAFYIGLGAAACGGDPVIEGGGNGGVSGGNKNYTCETGVEMMREICPPYKDDPDRSRLEMYCKEREKSNRLLFTGAGVSINEFFQCVYGVCSDQDKQRDIEDCEKGR